MAAVRRYLSPGRLLVLLLQTNIQCIKQLFLQNQYLFKRISYLLTLAIMEIDYKKNPGSKYYPLSITILSSCFAFISYIYIHIYIYIYICIYLRNRWIINMPSSLCPLKKTLQIVQLINPLSGTVTSILNHSVGAPLLHKYAHDNWYSKCTDFWDIQKINPYTFRVDVSPILDVQKYVPITECTDCSLIFCYCVSKKYSNPFYIVLYVQEVVTHFV